MNLKPASHVPKMEGKAQAATAAAVSPLAGLASALIPVAAERGKPLAEAQVTDEALFALAGKGDRNALERLIGRYEQALFGLLVRLTNGDRDRADDLFQETFLHAMRAAATFNGHRPFKPWLTAIAVNLVRDEARKRKVRGEVALDGNSEEEPGPPELASRDENPGQIFLRKDRDEQVRRALEKLTTLEREVILLHFFYDMTLKDTAAAVGAPLGTIKSRLHAGLSRLSELLERSE